MLITKYREVIIRFKEQSRARKVLGASEQFRQLNSAFLGIQAAFVFFALFHAWTLQYKSIDGNANFIHRISFKVDDQPWTPPGTVSTAVLHLHHFGDWTLNYLYSTISKPYSPDLEIPAPTPPLGLLMTRIISVLGMQYSFAVITLSALTLWVWSVQYFMKGFSKLNQLYGLIFIVLLTSPTIMAFDRGAVHIFTTGAISCALITYEQKKYKMSLLLLMLAVAFKPYTILVCLWLIREKKFRMIAQAIFIAVITNVVSLLVYYPNPFRGIYEYFRASLFYASDFMIPWALNGTSFVGFGYRVIAFFIGSDSNYFATLKNLYPWYIVMILLYSFFVVCVLRNQKVPNFIVMIFLLSTLSLAVPASLQYTLVWASLGSLFFVREFQSKKRTDVEYSFEEIKELRRLYVISAALFISILTPYFGFIPTLHKEALQYLNVILYVPILFVLACFVMKYYLLNSYHEFFQRKKK